MITVAYVLIGLGGLILLVGSILLVVAAFRVSTGWGLTVLFLSWLIVPLLAFLFKNWQAARIWFLFAVVGWIVSGLGWFVLAGTETMAVDRSESIVYATPAQQSTMEPLDIAAARPTADVPESTPTAVAFPVMPTATATPEPIAQSAQAPPPSRPTGYRSVAFDELDELIGERVELELTDGTIHVVVLEQVNSEGIKAAQRMGGGMMSYNVPRQLIADIRVRD
jgi:hypothetical protein